jgi:ribosomal protein S18 acetylase RimI-like enzyme
MPSRAYSHPGDLARILDFVRTVRPPERIGDDPHSVDLEELLLLPEIHANTRLWFGPAGELRACACVDTFDHLRFEFAPGSEGDFGADVVAWGEGIIRARGNSTLGASCRSEDQSHQDFLLAHGFERLTDRTLHYVRPLSQPIPEPLLPPGFIIRPLKGETEAAEVAALHCAAFGTEHMTLERRLGIMRASEYIPELDLVAVAPDGRLAAYTLGSVSAAENARTGRRDGSTDPLATHPDFQRRGLARALLLTGMKMLKERGLDTARLSTGGDNLAMQKTAESAGFVVEGRTLWFQKLLD